MQLSILQLNLFANKHKDKLFPYLKDQSFDVLLFQEITGPHTTFGNIDSPEDNYQELKAILGDRYNNELVVTDRFTNHPDSYLANGIFYKKESQFLNRREVFMHKRADAFPSEAKEYSELSRAILEVQLEYKETAITFATTHFAWGGTPQEKPHQTQQGEVLLDYLKTLAKPFIFTADMNIDPQQPVIQKINRYARNLITENHITNTLNPNTHAAKHMFPPGAAVDYIFVSDDITVNKFEVVEDDISDHLGLIAKIEI